MILSLYALRKVGSEAGQIIILLTKTDFILELFMDLARSVY